jgi:ubiquinone/menaquinone biosynthesis C-methylase UbiE
MGLNSFIARQLANPIGFGGKLVSFFMNRQNRPMYEETLRLLSLSDADTLLDIGCGNGFMLNMAAKQNKNTFTGIDTSESMIESAMRRNSLFVRNGQMRFFCQDLSAMVFESGSFSKVYTVNTVYFWDDLNDVMQEIGRVLKPSGVFINTLYSNDTLDRFSHTKIGYKRFSKQQLTEAGTNAGFAVDIVTILNGAAYCYLYRKIAKGD